ncbi:DUF4139 domain-containing protein [Apibacter raozihei]|uniref:DUF4139 domain-containing protein n=1 Tax=Apibacter raozihei TaxID=2500547 RepID=UPI001E3326AC|nr:DUF4139 domain-containing protein [Apibacter raozihei]
MGETNLKNEEYNINTSINENQLNISFDADIPYTIASNGKPYNICLAENSMPATYKYYAVPKLDSEVYLMAEVSQHSNYYFLKGEANITINGDYVGKTIIDPNQISDVLHLSIGKDKRVNVKREKVKELTSTKLFSSYNESVFTYDISVRNNKNTEIAVQLKDQYPLSSSNDITIDLLKTDHANDNKELGVLTWILNLKPNETKKVRVSYKIKYHKDKVLNL